MSICFDRGTNKEELSSTMARSVANSVEFPTAVGVVAAKNAADNRVNGVVDVDLLSQSKLLPHISCFCHTDSTALSDFAIAIIESTSSIKVPDLLQPSSKETTKLRATLSAASKETTAATHSTVSTSPLAVTRKKTQILLEWHHYQL